MEEVVAWGTVTCVSLKDGFPINVTSHQAVGLSLFLTILLKLWCFISRERERERNKREVNKKGVSWGGWGENNTEETGWGWQIEEDERKKEGSLWMYSHSADVYSKRHWAYKMERWMDWWWKDLMKYMDRGMRRQIPLKKYFLLLQYGEWFDFAVFDFFLPTFLIFSLPPIVLSSFISVSPSPSFISLLSFIH